MLQIVFLVTRLANRKTFYFSLGLSFLRESTRRTHVCLRKWSSAMRRLISFLLAMAIAPIGIAMAPGSVHASGSVKPHSVGPSESIRFDYITYGGSPGQELFVAVGESMVNVNETRIFTSTDGAAWTKRDVPTDHKNGGAVAYGGGKFVVFPNFPTQTGVLTSEDGITWTEHTAQVSPGYWRGLTYGGTGAQAKFVAVGATFLGIQGYTKHVATSADGITWTDQTVTDGQQGDAWNSVVHDGSKFVAVGIFSTSPDTNNRGLTMTSDDGVTWVRATTTSQPFWNSVANGDSRLVAVGPNGFALTPQRFAMVSTDSGNTWVESDIAHKSTSFLELTNPRHVAFGDDTFVAVGGDGGDRERVIRYIKDDATGWPDPATATDGGWVADSTYPSDWNSRRLSFGNGVFVGVGSSSKIYRSIDRGKTWVAATVGAISTGGTTTDGSTSGGSTTGDNTTSGDTALGGNSDTANGSATGTIRIDSKVYAKLPKKTEVNTALLVLTVRQARTQEIVPLTGRICTPVERRIALVGTGICTVRIQNKSTKKVVRTLSTQVRTRTSAAGTTLITFDPIMFFADSSTISAKAYKQIRSITKDAKNAVGIVVVGHATNRGKTTNLSLSKRRANAVRNYLVKLRVTKPIQTIGKGSLEPASTKKTRAGYAKNRRGVVYIIPSGK
jgi:outer membrane protein OmpA-like peptidoglycan-associated protein